MHPSVKIEIGKLITTLNRLSSRIPLASAQERPVLEVQQKYIQDRLSEVSRCRCSYLDKK